MILPQEVISKIFLCTDYYMCMEYDMKYEAEKLNPYKKVRLKNKNVIIDLSYKKGKFIQKDGSWIKKYNHKRLLLFLAFLSLLKNFNHSSLDIYTNRNNGSIIFIHENLDLKIRRVFTEYFMTNPFHLNRFKYFKNEKDNNLRNQVILGALNYEYSYYIHNQVVLIEDFDYNQGNEEIYLKLEEDILHNFIIN